MVKRYKRILLICAAAFALAGPANSAIALQEDVGAAGAKEVDASSKEAAAEKPVKRTATVRFVSPEAQVFKHKLEIYNRAKANSERLYCREDRMTGSHRKKMRCVTYERKQQEEDAARAFFRALR